MTCARCYEYLNGYSSCQRCNENFVKCPSCNTYNLANASKCRQCSRHYEVVCPYCLTPPLWYTTSVAPQCYKCKANQPPLYLDRYATYPPFFVQVFGWPRVGKTVFLSALTLLLRQMGKAWPNYSLMPATEDAQTKLTEINKFLAKGVMPGATQRGKNDVYIMIMQGMERWNNRMLVSRDCSGEIYDAFQVSTTEAPYLISVPTTLMLASLADLRNADDGKSVDMLMTSFLNTLRVNGLDFNASSYKGRRLVVVLSKGDLLEDLPSNLRNYLVSDPIWTALDTPGKLFHLNADSMTKYVAEMKTASDSLMNWLQTIDVGWINFVRLAQQHKISLRFSIISSTGGPVGADNTLPTALAPHRVLDPYFWALESW